VILIGHRDGSFRDILKISFRLKTADGFADENKKATFSVKNS